MNYEESEVPLPKTTDERYEGRASSMFLATMEYRMKIRQQLHWDSLHQAKKTSSKDCMRV